MEPTPDEIARRFPAFTASLDRAGLEAFAGALRLERVRGGDDLLVQGSPHPALYFLWEGHYVVVLRDDDAPGALGDLPPNSVVGEVSFLDGGPVNATVTARTRGSALKLGVSALAELTAARPDVASAIYHAIAESLAVRLRSATSRFEALGAATEIAAGTPALTPAPTGDAAPDQAARRRGITDLFRDLFGIGRR